MIDIVTEGINILNAITPLGIIGLLVYVVYLMIAKKGPIKLISDNHLSGLPEMAQVLNLIRESSLRQEMTLNEIRNSINYLRGRLNGRDNND